MSSDRQSRRTSVLDKVSTVFRPKPTAERWPQGLSTLAEGVDAAVDLVFVHGLNGHRERSWTATNNVHWPRDLLPAGLPHARLLAWGYDARTHGQSPLNHQLIHDHALTLVSDLCLHRKLTETPVSRPIIFIAHSLGGIVVKSALIHSNTAREGALEDHQLVKKSTYGIIFMGTPHQGSSAASIGEVLVNIASIFAPADSRVLRNLKRGSELLQQQLEQFNFISQDFETKFAYEQYSTPVAPGKSIFPDQIVPRASAVVPGQRNAESIAIPADHVNMIRFDSENDDGYRRVYGHLKLMVDRASEQLRLGLGPPPTSTIHGLGFDVRSALVPEPRQGTSTELLDLDITLPEHGVPNDISLYHGRIPMESKLLSSLAFKGMLDPMTSIPMETDGTCNWIFDDMRFRTWESRDNLDQHRGVLWVKGHPGTGKSTLMRRAFRRAQSSNLYPNALMAAFFFSNRSLEKLHRTATGFYRCILHQVLMQDRRALHEITKWFIAGISQDGFTWSETELRITISEVLGNLRSRPVFIFVDGLDECEGDGLFEVKNFIFQSSNSAFQANGCLSFCISSRYYRQINLPGALMISAEHGNRDDIIQHITLVCQEEPALEPLKEILLEKARGIFLWVVLVAALLKKSCRGRSARFLRELAEQIPPRLEDLYLGLFQGIRPEDAAQTRFLVYVLLFAYEPWNLACIHTGLCFSAKQFRSLGEFQKSPDFLETAQKRHEQVLDVSLGLVQAIVPSPLGEVVLNEDCLDNNTTYQFIHGTVRDFFLSGRGFESLYEPTGIVAVEKRGHLALTVALTRYLGTEELLFLIRDYRDYSSQASFHLTSHNFPIEEHNPFLDLAFRQVFRHFTEASFQDLSLPQSLPQSLALVGSTGLEALDLLQSSADMEFPYSKYALHTWIVEATPRHYAQPYQGTSINERDDIQLMRSSLYRTPPEYCNDRIMRRQESMVVETESRRTHSQER